MVEKEEKDDRDRSSLRPKKPFDWRAVLAVLLLAAGVGFGWQWWRSRQDQAPTEQQQQQATPVEIAPVETTTLEETSEFVGTLEADRTAVLRAETDGQVVEIFVREGDFVSEGEILARLDAREARSDVEQAEANLRRERAQLAELEAGNRIEDIQGARARVAQAEANLEEERARLQELRSGSRPEDISAAEAAYNRALADVEEARSRLDLARTEAERARQLEREGAIARNQLDRAIDEERQAAANLRQQEAAAAEARSRLEREESGFRSEEIAQAEAAVSRREGELAEAEAELAEAETGARPEEIDRAQADVEAARSRVNALEVAVADTAIRAPFSGTLGDITVKVGDYLQEGDRFASLTENNSLDVRLQIPLERLPELRLGTNVALISADGDELAEGTINFISPQINAESQTVLVKATFDNPDGSLLDGQFVRAEVIWRDRPGAVVVPTNAITFQGERRFVYVVQDGEPLTVEQRYVELGIVAGDRTEIAEGLETGDRIVVSGLQKLFDGAAIAPMEEGEFGD